MTADQVPLYLGLAVSLFVLGASLWYLSERPTPETGAAPAPEPDDPLEALEAPAEELTPAEDGRLRLRELRGTDRLALDELLTWSGREDLSRWYRDPAPSGPDTQTDPTGRPASPADTSGSGGQRDA